MSNNRSKEELARELSGLQRRYTQLQNEHEELKQYSEALVQSGEHAINLYQAERYVTDMLMNNTPDHIYFKDLQSRFIRASRTQVKAFGLKNIEEVEGKTDFDFFTDEHAQQAFDDEQRIIRTGEPLINYVEKETWPDGSITWVSTTKVALRDDTGTIIGTFGISRDITKQKRAEDALNQERILLRTLIDNIPDHIYVKDTQSKKIVANRTEYLRLGFTSEAELLGKDDFDIFPREQAQKFHEVDQRVMDEHNPQLDIVDHIITPDGNQRWLQSSKMPLFNSDGELVGLVGIGRDITEYKLAERALKESEKKFRTLFEAMTEMVVIHELVLDKKGKPINYRITDCNRAFTRVTRITRKAAVGKLADRVYQSNEPPYLKQYSPVGLGGKPIRFDTFYAPLNKYLSVSAISLGLNQFATISTDVTYARQAQQIIAAKNKELEQIVYVASHDLRSPLVNVEGYGRELEYTILEIKSALEKDECPDSELTRLLSMELPDMEEALKLIRGSTRQMDSLLKGLLKLSRLGRAALSIEPIDMDKLIGQVICTFEYQANAVAAQIRVGDLPPCKGDMVQLTQIFTNLIGNALKYLCPDRKGDIYISGRIVNSRSEYCVEDNGIGIAPNHLEGIFELFRRLNPSKTEGEGLGLTIVRQILTRLDGDIRVESDLGKGSRFYISLPFEQLISNE